MADTLPVRFKCPICRTRVTWPDNAVESTKIACKNCGADLGTYRDLCDQATEGAAATIKSIIEKAFKSR